MSTVQIPPQALAIFTRMEEGGRYLSDNCHLSTAGFFIEPHTDAVSDALYLGLNQPGSAVWLPLALDQKPLQSTKLPPSPKNILPLTGDTPTVEAQLEEQILTSNFPFLTIKDIEHYTNHDELLRQLRETTNFAVLQLAHEFATALKREIGEIVKDKLWGSNAPEGEIRFSAISDGNGNTFFNAKAGNSTKGISKDHFVALAQARQNTKTTSRHGQSGRNTTSDHLKPDHK